MSTRFYERCRGRLDEAARAAGTEISPVLLPPGSDGRLEPPEKERIDIAFFSGEVFADGEARGFFAAAQGAPNLKWMHLFNAGVDNPVFTRLLEQGVRLTTSSGSTAPPIAHSVMGGVLMLSRGFVLWLDGQRRHAWEPIPLNQLPVDLGEQTLTVLGLGAIGSEVARLARAFGLHVIGVRRSPARPGDPVDELVPPSALAEVLPRTDWLVVACPLTAETRHIVDAAALAALRPGARVVNIARGEVIDEQALIGALRSGQVGGAYLDVFETEPLPPESPLWDLPNVIISPHNSPASKGNDDRVTEIFFRNLRHWLKGEAMENEVG
jgi:phosphoglycerate dehydrogenase-like enzyme